MPVKVSLPSKQWKYHSHEGVKTLKTSQKACSKKLSQVIVITNLISFTPSPWHWKDCKLCCYDFLSTENVKWLDTLGTHSHFDSGQKRYVVKRMKYIFRNVFNIHMIVLNSLFIKSL